MKWIRTLEGERINLDNIVELSVTTNDYRHKDKCCVIAVSINRTYYLWAEDINDCNEESVISRAEMFIDAIIAEHCRGE